jgi:hypothetical protein
MSQTRTFASMVQLVGCFVVVYIVLRGGDVPHIPLTMGAMLMSGPLVLVSPPPGRRRPRQLTERDRIMQQAWTEVDAVDVTVIQDRLWEQVQSETGKVGS